MTTNLVFLRHGETDWNLKHRYQGQMDIPLNATGEQQAKDANLLLRGMHFDQVYCSDLNRAMVTARYALEGIYPYEKIIFDRRLRERSFGIYEGGPYDKDKMPQRYLDEMKRDPENFKFPEGESLNDVYRRVRPFYDMIIEKYRGKTVLLVAHGSLLSIVQFMVEGQPVIDKNRNHLPNAKPFTMTVD